MLPKFHHTQVTCYQNFITQTGYISMHTRDVQQHKGSYFIPTANTSWLTGSIQHVLLHHHSQKHIKCDQHIQPTSQHVLLHHHCLLQHYSYNQKDGQHQECYIQIATHKTNTASHAFPVLANHFFQLVQILL